MIKSKVTDKNILKDVEAYLNILEELFEGDHLSNDAFCKRPKYAEMLCVFGFTDFYQKKKNSSKNIY